VTPTQEGGGGRSGRIRAKRARRGHKTLIAQQARARAIVDGDKKANSARFVQVRGDDAPSTRPAWPGHSPWSASKAVSQTEGRIHAVRGRRRHHCLRRIPCLVLEKDLEHQSARGSTKKSNAVPMRSASFPTPRRCCAWPDRSSSGPTTNGRSLTSATYPKPPWHCSIPRPTRAKHCDPSRTHGTVKLPQSLRRTPARLIPLQGTRPKSVFGELRLRDSRVVARAFDPGAGRIRL
jgi:hypothetical protein